MRPYKAQTMIFYMRFNSKKYHMTCIKVACAVIASVPPVYITMVAMQWMPNHTNPFV